MQSFSVLMYERFRSPMQHALGLALKRPDRQGIRETDARADAMVVFRDKESLDEKQVEEMEQGGWPSFLRRPTVERANGVLHLTVEAFYVGTRRLIASVLAQKEHMQHAARHLAPRVNQTSSGATASAISTVDTSWIPSKDG